MEPNQRSANRLLSSLRDLRLINNQNFNKTLQRKRQEKRLCPIKARLQDEIIYQKFKIVDKNKSQSDLNFISNSLSHHFTFSSLIENKIMQDQLINKFRMCRVDQKEYLLKQNDKASSFFILKQGELKVQINGQYKSTIQRGEGFGELALLYSIPRSASIYAQKTSVLWFIDRLTFRNVVSSLILKTYQENKNFIEKNKFFSYLTDQQKQKITSIALIQKFQKGKNICQQGQQALSMYIVKSGNLKRYINGFYIGQYKSGDSFQEYVALTKNCLRKQTITAEQNTQLMAFGTQDIQKVLGKSLPLIILRNNAKKVLLQDKNFRLLSNEILEKVIDCFQIRNVKSGQQVFAKGDFCKNKIIFIIEGDYLLLKSEHYNTLYGSECLNTQNRMTTYNFACVFKTQGKIAVTNIQKIQLCIGYTIEQAFHKSNSTRHQIQKRRSKLIDLKSFAKSFDIKDFLVLKKLGQGQFGQVFLVTYGKSNETYALKCISKAQTLKYKLEKHLINQKKVLQTINSPFTVDFIRSFNDQDYVYFLTEFIDGLELFDALRIIGIVPFNLAVFYTAILVLALESLHNCNFIYRDLKPQNIMVQSQGYLKLIDMGTCKCFKSTASGKTFTIIGTPNYMAPEILSGKGYSYSVDLWSLGVMLFEFMSGYLPFGQNFQDPYEIYQQILSTHLKFPKFMNNNTANNFIIGLLNRNSQARLGQSYQQLKRHYFFKQIDWSRLIQRKIVPSFKPPSVCFLKLEQLQKNQNKIDHYLKNYPQTGLKRTDINLDWDAFF